MRPNTMTETAIEQQAFNEVCDEVQDPVVQRAYNTIQWIHYYPADKSWQSSPNYSLDFLLGFCISKAV